MDRTKANNRTEAQQRVDAAIKELEAAKAALEDSQVEQGERRPGMTMKFYEFRQKNSGGSFAQDENLSVVVLIEAESARAANEKAEGIGIYFDGCESGCDCNCCGDRWSPVGDDNWDTISTVEVDIRLSGVDEFIPDGYFGHSPSVIVHYADGTKRTNKI